MDINVVSSNFSNPPININDYCRVLYVDNHIYTNGFGFFHSKPYAFCLFFLSTVLAKTSRTVMNKSCNNKHLYLVPGWKAMLTTFNVRYTGYCRFFVYVFFKMKEACFYFSSFLRVSIRRAICQMVFIYNRCLLLFC